MEIVPNKSLSLSLSLSLSESLSESLSLQISESLRVSLRVLRPLVFGGCAFPPVSLGPAGDCPCRD